MKLPEEQQVLNVKYASKRIGTMAPIELELTANELLLKIHVITGWNVPAQEFMLILVDQFKKKMQENYGNVNVDEVEYAFRKFGTVVKDWGKQLNLALIDEVMIEYLAHRAEISKQEAGRRIEPPQIEAKKTLSDEEWNEWLQDIKNYDTSIVPVSAYDRLEANGLVVATSKKIEFFELAKQWYLARCKEGTDEHRDFIKWMKNQKKDATHQIISDYAKKLIVKAYLNGQL